MNRILSIAEITEIEGAYELGVPSLGVAAEHLLARWNFNLRDEETAIRLIFMRWYSHTEPSHLTGLGDNVRIPTTEEIVKQIGGETRLSAETMFAIAVLCFDAYAFGMGDENKWRKNAQRFFVRAAELEPKSYLFSDWKYLIGEKRESMNLKTKMEAEAHARFHGRGYLGTYLVHIIGGLIRPNKI